MRKKLSNFKKLTREDIEEMFITYKNPLYSFIYSRVRNTHEAEDLLSKTFIKIINYSAKNIIETSKIKGLLYTTAANIIKDFFRRASIINFFSLDKALPNNKEQTYYDFFSDNKSLLFIDNIDNKNMIKEINLLISTLPANQSEAFYLRFIEGFSFEEVATIQKTSVSTALSRVRYAVNKIKDSLNRQEML